MSHKSSDALGGDPPRQLIGENENGSEISKQDTCLKLF